MFISLTLYWRSSVSKLTFVIYSAKVHIFCPSIRGLSCVLCWVTSSWWTIFGLHFSLYWANSFRAQFFISISCRSLLYSSAKDSNSLPKIAKEASFNSTDCFSAWQALSSVSSFSLKLRHTNGWLFFRSISQRVVHLKMFLKAWIREWWIKKDSKHIYMTHTRERQCCPTTSTAAKWSIWPT